MEKITLLFEGRRVHCFESNGQMWFCGQDVCDVLGCDLNALDTDKQTFFDPTAVHGESLMISEFSVIQLATEKPFREFIKQAIIALRAKTCDRIDELEYANDKLRDEICNLKEILNEVPIAYRGDYEEEYVPSKKSRHEAYTRKMIIESDYPDKFWKRRLERD
jgi:hypothetical protein